MITDIAKAAGISGTALVAILIIVWAVLEHEKIEERTADKLTNVADTVKRERKLEQIDNYEIQAVAAPQEQKQAIELKIRSIKREIGLKDEDE